MAVNIEGLFESSLKDKIKNSKILVIGAGGIGCELLKNLVLTGFEELHVIDLDTIELSNLNRQFLFHKQHIGKPKAVVARESVLKFNPKANITAYHDSIYKKNFNVQFYQQFSAVANALDNVAARCHVNRMCIASDIPFIESGSAGFLGDVTVYKKVVTECYECVPRRAERTFPGCTIRNTPSEPVHCIVWAKNLFNQLFGEEDADQDVSPDLMDPELVNSPREDGNVHRVSTREWAVSVQYNPQEIFDKLYNKDIKYLLEMENLWKERRPPIPLNFNDLPDAVAGSSKDTEAVLKDQVVWSVKQCADVFVSCMAILKKRRSTSGEPLIWDKDDETAMDFVTAVSNLRSHCFGIKMQSRFDAKAIAGNIIPAIATTNAIVAGLIVLQLINVLKGDFSKCSNPFMRTSAGSLKKLISTAELRKPNPKCFVCSSITPEVSVKLNLATLTIKTLEEKIIKDTLRLAQPDVFCLDKATILISSDPDDFDEGLKNKTLREAGLLPFSRVLCEDYFQHYKVIVKLIDNGDIVDQDFKMQGFDVDEMKKTQKQQEEKDTQTKSDRIDNVNEADMDEEPDIKDVDPEEPEVITGKKRTVSVDDVSELPPTKKTKADI